MGILKRPMMRTFRRFEGAGLSLIIRSALGIRLIAFTHGKSGLLAASDFVAVKTVFRCLGRMPCERLTEADPASKAGEIKTFLIPNSLPQSPCRNNMLLETVF